MHVPAVAKSHLELGGMRVHVHLRGSISMNSTYAG